MEQQYFNPDFIKDNYPTPLSKIDHFLRQIPLFDNTTPLTDQLPRVSKNSFEMLGLDPDLSINENIALIIDILMEDLREGASNAVDLYGDEVYIIISSNLQAPHFDYTFAADGGFINDDDYLRYIPDGEGGLKGETEETIGSQDPRHQFIREAIRHSIHSYSWGILHGRTLDIVAQQIILERLRVNPLFNGLIQEGNPLLGGVEGHPLFKVVNEEAMTLNLIENIIGIVNAH